MINIELTARLFWRHVVRASEHFASHRLMAIDVVTKHASDAEIEHFWNELSRRVFRRKHDVVGLEIAMNDAFGVRSVKRCGNGQKHLHRDGWFEPLLACDELTEGIALEQFHHEVRIANFGLTEVEHAHDARMS